MSEEVLYHPLTRTQVISLLTQFTTIECGHLNENVCDLWLGRHGKVKKPDGSSYKYPLLMLPGKAKYGVNAARVVFNLYYGRDIAFGNVLVRTCLNHSCVNYHHIVSSPRSCVLKFGRYLRFFRGEDSFYRTVSEYVEDGELDHKKFLDFYRWLETIKAIEGAA